MPKDARVLHLLSPFDLAVPVRKLWSSITDDRALQISATVYDLIPALDPAHELIDPMQRRRYKTHLELVRAASSIHVLSRAVAGDVQRVLGTRDEDIFVVGAAPDSRFCPAPDKSRARQQAMALLTAAGLERPFVLYPSGSHPRKNNELLIRAWAQLPDAVRKGFQLVMTGDVAASTAHHYHYLADSLQITGELVVAGYVDDAALLALVQGADLVCFPSLAEGYGLPVVEALACRTPVVASDRPPIDELLDDEARFDPTDPQAICEALRRALSDPVTQEHLAAQALPPATSWEAVATNSASAFDELIRKHRPSIRRRARSDRLCIGFVSPLPPAPTGVSDYSFRLIEELIATGDAEVDVFVDGARRDEQLAPHRATTHRVVSLRAIEALRGRYDDVVYTFGNSHNHLGALTMLRRRPGVVLSHDVRLSNLYRHAYGDPGLLPGGFSRAIRAMYGTELPRELGMSGELAPIDIERYGVLMAREVISCSEAFLVTSRSAAVLARIDAGAGHEDKVAVLPFAFEVPRATQQAFGDSIIGPPDHTTAAFWGQGPDHLEDVRVIAHFGIVDPVKCPELLLQAFASTHEATPDTVLAFVGPISDELAHLLVSRADALGVAGRLILTGPVRTTDYRAWLERATLAVQLRLTSNGEASAAVGACLSCGVPTIVSALGWFSELPADAVVPVPREVSSAQLASAITTLLNDDGRRQSLSSTARQWAGEHDFAAVAQSLLEFLRARRASDTSTSAA